MTTTTAAIYVPLSPDNVDSALALREYALQKGWKVLEYRERPSRAGKRPILNRMLFAAWQHRFGVVLVPSLDCLADSLTELSEKVMSLERQEIRFVVADGSIGTDRDTPAGRSFLRTLTILAKAESSMRLRNVRAGIAMAQRRGIHCGRPRVRVPLAQARRLREEGLSIRAIGARIGIPASTVADALRVGDRKPKPRPFRTPPTPS